MMRETPSHSFSDHIHHLFAELNPEHVEQFYTSYQRWLHQQHIAGMQAKMHSLQRHIAENTWRMQQVHPSPIALAILARLQSKGVTDIELLDRLLERGEIWLDQTMQHLEYCEQLDFMRDNYTEWCRNALDGAYDWIESIHDRDTAMSPSTGVEEVKTPVLPADESSRGRLIAPTVDVSVPTIDATEEAFLQKLMSEEVEEEEVAFILETTLKIPLVSPAETLETPALDTVSAIEEAQTEQKEVEAGEVGEVEQLQEAAVSIEEAPEEQPQEEETIIYFVDDLEMLPLEILAEPVGQEAEPEQPDYSSMTEAWLPLAELAPAEYVPTPEEVIPSAVEKAGDAINQVTATAGLVPTVHEEDSPAYADTVPAVEVSGTSDLPVIENGAAASIREGHLLSAESEDHTQNDEGASPPEEISEDAWESEHQEFMKASVEPLAASNDALWRWEDPLPSEANAPGDQGTLSTQQSNAQVSQETQQKPPQKRTFLQGLFAIFWRR